MVDHYRETDVLIVGGGVAGCVAAIRAREAGARVLIVDKVRSIRRSGDAGQWIGFLTSYLDQGEETDTPEVFARWYGEVADDLVDMAVARKVGVEPLPEVVAYLEQLGMPLRDPRTGQYVRHKRPWTPGSWTIVFDGHDFKPILAQRAVAAGAEVLGGVHVTSVLTDDTGRAVGVTGIDFRTCEFIVIRARSVILAAGNPERVIHNPSRNSFNSYHRAAHGTTGYALAVKAGAEAANLEFVGAFVMTKGFSPAVPGTLAEGGGKLINSLGQSVYGLPEDTGERKFGHGMIAKATREILAGRGPLFLDCRHLSREKLDELLGYISYDGPMTLEYLAQSGIDVAQDLIELEFFMGTWSATASPKGIVIDERCQTRVPGLFAAGDMATPCYACMGSVATGYVAGSTAADFATQVGAAKEDREQVAAEKARVLAPLSVRQAGIPWNVFENQVRDVMTHYVGVSRSQLGLRYALRYLENYQDHVPQLAASNGHELMRCLESSDIVLFDRMMAAAALERDETRFQYLMAHYRADFPEKNDATWKGIANIVRLEDGQVVVERRRMNP